MDSAKISAVVKPILKKLHPDLFFHLNSTADKESIADINKKCILNIQNIWTQIFYYDKVFMIPLLSAVTLKGSVEQDNEHDKLDPEYETLQKHLDALHPERKFTWQLPMSRYLESEYCFDCYHFSRSQHTDSSADVKKIQFTLKIPSIFLRSPSNSQNLGQITAATYIKSFNSLLTQQGQFFDLLQLHFPYQRNCDLLNDYLQQVDAAEAFTAFAPSRMTFSEALSTKQKAALHSRLMLEQHYYRKSKDFSEFLQWEGKKIMEEIKKKRAGQPSRISPIILENLDLIVKAYRTKVPKMIMNQINYFLHTNHVRFQRVPQREEAALLLTLQSFFIRYHDVLLFDYSHYKSIFILVYWNESVQRRGGDLYQCHSFNSDEMPQVVREGFASHSPEGKKTYDSEEKQNKHYYILRVPHNFIPSDFTNFISENIPMSALRLLDAA